MYTLYKFTEDTIFLNDIAASSHLQHLFGSHLLYSTPCYVYIHFHQKREPEDEQKEHITEQLTHL